MLSFVGYLLRGAKLRKDCENTKLERPRNGLDKIKEQRTPTLGLSNC